MQAKHFKLKIKQACHNNVGRGCEKQQQHIAAKVILCPESLAVPVINQFLLSCSGGYRAGYLPDQQFSATRQNVRSYSKPATESTVSLFPSACEGTQIDVSDIVLSLH